MGFRYRKSVNLPFGFRVNFSKSGVGYSWGTKGYRITKTAKGTIRETHTLPGTGLSYVKESKVQNKKTGQAEPISSTYKNTSVESVTNDLEPQNLSLLDRLVPVGSFREKALPIVASLLSGVITMTILILLFA